MGSRVTKIPGRCIPDAVDEGKVGCANAAYPVGALSFTAKFLYGTSPSENRDKRRTLALRQLPKGAGGPRSGINKYPALALVAAR